MGFAIVVGLMVAAGVFNALVVVADTNVVNEVAASLSFGAAAFIAILAFVR